MTRLERETLPANGDGAADHGIVEVDRAQQEDVFATPAEPVAAADPNAETNAQAIGQVIFQLFLSAVVLAVAGGLVWLLVEQKTAPATLPLAKSAPSVLVRRVTNETRPTQIRGYGNVRASRRVQLAAQVGGRVVETNPQLVTGGTLPGGAVVLRIDSTDYDLAVDLAQAALDRAAAGLTRVDAKRQAAQAQVAQAQTALQTADAESEVARAEFRRINPGEEVPPLVAKEPQAKQAAAGLQAAEAGVADVDAEQKELEAARTQAEAELRQARVNRGRAEVRLPEGGPWRVTSETVDVGQNVAPGQTFADVYDASSLEVAVPLEDRQLQWIDFAGGDREQLKSAGIEENPATRPGSAVADKDSPQGSAATVSAEYAGSERSWAGRVRRTEGQIDPRTRLVEVVIVADAPASSDGGARLVPGLFVDAEIDGKPVEGAATIPRRALHAPEDDDSPDARQVVYVARNNKLEIVPVDVVRRGGDDVAVRGLQDGAAVILTRLDVVTPGMELQLGDEPATTQASQ